MLDQLPFLQSEVFQMQAPVSLFDRMSPNDVLPILIVGMALLTGIILGLTSIIFGTWRRVRERQIAASLIQDMLDRNMSPMEIQQVTGLWAGASGGRLDVTSQIPSGDVPRRPPRPAKPAKPLV